MKIVIRVMVKIMVTIIRAVIILIAVVIPSAVIIAQDDDNHPTAKSGRSSKPRFVLRTSGWGR